MKKSFSVYKQGVQPRLSEVSQDHKTDKSAETWIKSQSPGTYIVLPVWTISKDVKVATKKVALKKVTKKKTVKKVAPKAKRKVKRVK